MSEPESGPETEPEASKPPGAPAPGADIDALDTDAADTSRKGFIAAMAQNPVAANIILFVLLVGGLIIGGRVKQEVFPEFDLDMILVNVPYPGASPSEVEQGVVLAIEEAVRGLDGVKEVRSTATEGVAVVAVDLLLGTDSSKALADVKAAVDRITSFPADAERPVVALATNRFQVLNLVIYGDKTEAELRALAERTRDELLLDDRITLVELDAVRPYEISIDVSQEDLRRYGLTLDQIAATIRQSSVELPGGAVRTSGGDVLVRMASRRLRGSEFEDIVLLSRADGTEVRVRDVATVDDGFAETDQEAFYDGKRAALVRIYRVGDQTPITVSDAAHEYIDANRDRLPDGVDFAIWYDASEVYRDRIDLLTRNAFMGLALVMLSLGLFLEIRLAFWVTLGIPVSFLGTLLFMPMLGASINMISLFAFIVTLGMVVDDAIVVSEAVYKRRQEGMAPLDAVLAGTREVAMPVVFSILTTCVAFAPLLFVEGMMGKFFWVIPVIVISVLLVSLFESLFILPAHLAHDSKVLRILTRIFFLHKLNAVVEPAQQRFARLVEKLVEITYVPTARWAVQNRYVTFAICVAMLMGATGVVAGGRIGFTFMPRIESDIVSAQIVLPFGSSVEETRLVEERVAEALDEVVAANGGDAIVRGVFSQLAAQSGGGRGGPGGGGTSTGSHLAEVSLYLVPMDQRDVTAADITQAWRRAVGEVAGLERLSFQFSTGPATDAPINVELAHTDIDTLEGAATRLAAQLSTYGGVTDVDDGFAEGKEQLDFQLTAEGRAAGLTEMELARQVRSAFFGAEAVRQQRGRDEVRVYVRRPEAERSSLAHLEQFIVRTPAGGEIPLGQAANIVRGRSYTQITRVNGKRVVNVTADVEREAMATEVQAALMTEVLPAIKADTPGLRFDSGGQQRRRAESLGSLGTGFQIALFVMYGLIAMAFRRYVQPLVVMTAIPFGFVGALIGHLLMGYDLSLMSMMGLVALSGVAVNDSIVLVDAINRFRRGLPLVDAVVAAGSRRFRPILLTSITTFFGLAPMIFETSVQARFLIPMALSLGFGVLFATFITLVLVPALYVIVDDTVNALGRFKRFMWPDLAEVEHAAERGSAAPRALGAHDPESPAPGE